MSQRVGDRPRSRRRRLEKPIGLDVPPGVRLRVSSAGFWRLCAANRDLRLERTAQGVLIVMSPAGSQSGASNAELSGQLFVWAKADGTGLSFDSSTGFTLPNGAVRAPDASWIRRSRWEALAPEQMRKFAPICPDFVAELMSPSDDRPDVQAKMREYIEQGVRLGWLIDPEAGEVEIYRPSRPVETLDRPQTLSGEGVLPGFVLDLKGILFD
jgi:Uma2 family endonuclease